MTFSAVESLPQWFPFEVGCDVRPTVSSIFGLWTIFWTCPVTLCHLSHFTSKYLFVWLFDEIWLSPSPLTSMTAGARSIYQCLPKSQTQSHRSIGACWRNTSMWKSSWEQSGLEGSYHFLPVRTSSGYITTYILFSYQQAERTYGRCQYMPLKATWHEQFNVRWKTNMHFILRYF